MKLRILILAIGVLTLSISADGEQRVNVKCHHDEGAVTRLITYKHYNQERRTVLAEYDAQCMDYNPAMQKECLALIDAYEEIKKEIERDTVFVFTGFLQGENVPRYKCYDLVGKRGKSMKIWKKKAA